MPDQKPNQMQRIVLASRPRGAPVPENFRLETAPLPTPDDGEVLVRVHYMSLDPYMRGRMDDAKSYANPVPIGGVMESLGVGEVIASNAPELEKGAFVAGGFGWATHAVAAAKGLQRVDPEQMPLPKMLGVLGMPGFTGWFALMEHGRPKKGETLVVGAATGPVGSMVGQWAKTKGLRAVGIAGGAKKCALAIETFGFDACIDHHGHSDARSLRAALKTACPDGIDIYFENIGGMVLEAVLPLMNTFGRIPLCGMVAWYNTGSDPRNAGPSAQSLWRSILIKHLSVNGFIISDHWDRYPEFLGEVGPKVADGTILSKEDITEGLQNAPQAFMDMLEGGNFGKAVVKLV